MGNLEQDEKNELLDCIQNLMGLFDTPIARKKFNGDIYSEAREIGTKILKKNNRNHRGI